MHHMQPVSLVASGDRSVKFSRPDSGSQASAPLFTLSLEGGVHPSGGSEHVECGIAVLMVSKATSQIGFLGQGLLCLAVLYPRPSSLPSLPLFSDLNCDS